MLECARKLDARDRPQQSHVTHEMAQQQAYSYLAEVRAKIDADRRELDAARQAAAAGGTVIPGQVERPAIEG